MATEVPDARLTQAESADAIVFVDTNETDLTTILGEFSTYTKDTDTDLSSNGWFLDEDDMASDDATKAASQQSIKAYADSISGQLTPSSVSADVNPAVAWISYFVNASAAIRTIVLPDVAASNDGAVIRVILTDNANECDITTVGGTQLIGSATTQSITAQDAGITMMAVNADSSWHIIQDSRPKVQQSAITCYGLTESGAVGGYNRLALSTTDSDYSTTATDLSIGTVTGAAQNLGGWVADQGVIQGLISETNADTLFALRRTAGSGSAEFYIEIYHRNTGGTETLLGTSGLSSEVTSASYVTFDLKSIVAEQNFVSTDYLVIKFYANRIPGGSDPTYDVKLEGLSDPARFVLPVASSVVPHSSLTGLTTGDDHTQYLLVNGTRAGTGAQQLSSIELGDASDTTLARVSAGIASIEGKTIAMLSQPQEYTRTQNFNATTLTDAASIAWNLEQNQVAKVTLAGNRTLAAPTNLVDGGHYTLRVIQDATGSRTLAYNAVFKWPGGTAPTLTADGNAIDILHFISDGTNMYGTSALDFS